MSVTLSSVPSAPGVKAEPLGWVLRRVAAMSLWPLIHFPNWGTSS